MKRHVWIIEQCVGKDWYVGYAIIEPTKKEAVEFMRAEMENENDPDVKYRVVKYVPAEKTK